MPGPAQDVKNKCPFLLIRFDVESRLQWYLFLSVLGWFKIKCTLFYYLLLNKMCLLKVSLSAARLFSSRKLLRRGEAQEGRQYLVLLPPGRHALSCKTCRSGSSVGN